MFDKLKRIEKRFEEINALLCDPAVIADKDRLKTLGREQSEIQDIVYAFREYEKIKQNLDGNLSLIADDSDPELAEMAEDENIELKKKLAEIDAKLKLLLVPKDPDDMKNAIVEIRAGTGGDEAALFALDMFNMYQRYAALKGYAVETLSISPSQTGGVKEVIALVSGKNAYGSFRYESGVHRVQRVPKTETQGRIHTSAVTVAVLPEVEEAEVELSSADLKIDVYRSSGPGGQSVNTTDSAVRITHLPTGIVVAMQDEKSQIKNRVKAMKVLLSRVQSHYSELEKDKQDADRRRMVGSGDRSERIRTYNFPQGRVTDHRINLTLYSLNNIMMGELDELVENLRRAANAEALASPAAN
jgi:peptide chain release factor 1